MTQTSPWIYRIGFSDKARSPYQLDRPLEFLSQAALDRRYLQGIMLDSLDLPVSPAYLDSLTQLGFRLKSSSRWFNSVLVETKDTLEILTLASKNYISEIRRVRDPVARKTLYRKDDVTLLPTGPPLQYQQYGYSQVQVEQPGGHHLHSLGYLGENTLIAVIDGGFTGITSLSSFNNLQDQGRLAGTYDFVNRQTDVDLGSSHGTIVFSIMATRLPGMMIGTAPAARYLLLRSEDSFSEYPVEEDYWAMAAEYADSAGAQVINSSLGYSVYDNPAMSYQYEDMDGKTTRVARAAQIASQKGMIVVTSAGNSGNKPWKYITSPADAYAVLSVGAVDHVGLIADFSSRGPSFDGRVKPEMAAMGKGTAVQEPSGQLSYCNGTSCSAPVITGLVACLWQAFPGATAQEIRDAVTRTANRYNQPDNNYGYGIPDFRLAYRSLAIQQNSMPDESFSAIAYPNPFTGKIILELYDASGDLVTYHQGPARISLYAITGRKLLEKEMLTGGAYMPFLDPGLPAELEAGCYLLVVSAADRKYHLKIVKQ